jgi:hypothetical protein
VVENDELRDRRRAPDGDLRLSLRNQRERLISAEHNVLNGELHRKANGGDDGDGGLRSGGSPAPKVD